MTNGVVDGKVLVTAQESNNSDSDEGYDDSDGTPGIAFVGTMTDDAVVAIADAVKNNDVTPGGQRFAEYYNGITINLPEGEGLITAIIEAEPGYTWHLSIDGEDFVCLIEGDAKIENYHVESYNEDGYPMVRVDISYHVNRPTYCYLYLVKDNAGVRGIAPIGKRDKAHGKIVTVGVKVVKSAGKNPPSEASGGVIPEETDIVTGITDNSIIDNHIRVDNDRWYNLNGQQVDKPTKQGLYIHKGKKVFLQ